MYYHQKNYAKALSYFQKAIQIMPKTAHHYANAGIALQALNQPKQALVHLQQACKLAPDNASHFSNLGAFYQKFGELKLAVQSFQLKQCVDYFHLVSSLIDRDLAQKIYGDQIDILIDLNGHTAKNRLLVSAYKPAPIQCCYIGYPMTTGLSRMDYLIVDKQVCPAGTESLYTEKLAYLSDCVFSFKPHDFAPAVSNLPAFKNRYVTFGCFNNVPKLNPTVIKLWSEILKYIPDARLILKSRPFNDESTQRRYVNLFCDYGVDSDRITLRGGSSHPDMLAELADIDVALDPFPFSGGTTTIETLWQGIPIITLKGSRFSQNMTSSYLHMLGLDDWICPDQKAYLQKAVSCARNINALSSLRSQLRDKLKNSIICQSEAFAKQLEALYYQLWTHYCDS